MAAVSISEAKAALVPLNAQRAMTNLWKEWNLREMAVVWNVHLVSRLMITPNESRRILYADRYYNVGLLKKQIFIF